jgi:tetratricopeptide (TPR) repeat protein
MQAAIHFYSQLALVESNNIDVYTSLADIYDELELYQDAIDCYEKAI